MSNSTENSLRILKTKNFKAVNVTIPYKQAVIPYLDDITEAARKIGAVNCIRNDGGKLTGHNTDFDGLLALAEHAGVVMTDKKVLILGSGGTSDTANAVCKALGAAEIIKVSRSGKDGAATYEEACRLHGDAHVIINTTPCGMYPMIYESPVDLGCFAQAEGVLDVIYNPLRTQLTSDAAARGLKAANGLYMLVAQAISASEFFLSTKYDKGLTDRIFEKVHADKSNIVLTGMPASGKSTIGRILAKELGRELIDTDMLIEKKTGMSIPEIFARYGEEYFRDTETEVIKEVSGECGKIIATGGGVIIRKENVNALKLNGRVFFVDRNPELLIPTKNRPTAFDREQIDKRYAERYPIYTATADYIIENQGTSAAAARKIREVLG